MNLQLEDVHDCFDKWFDDYDHNTIEYVLAVVITNYIKGVPYWTYLVGSSGAGKTSLVNSLKKFTINGREDVMILNEFTPATLIVGKKGEEEDLAKTMNGKVVVTTDLAQLMTLHPDVKKQLWGKMRTLYDGLMQRATAYRRTEIELSAPPTFIICATPAIDNQVTLEQELGTRCLYWRMPTRYPKLKVLIDNSEKKRQLNIELKETVQNFLREKLTPQNIKKANDYELNDEELQYIDDGGDYLVKMRAFGKADAYSGDLIADVDEEAPTRCKQQLVKLYKALLFLYGFENREKIKKMMIKIIDDSIDPRKRRVYELMQDGAERTTYQVHKEIGYSRKTCRTMLGTLRGQGILDVIIDQFDENAPIRYKKSNKKD